MNIEKQQGHLTAKQKSQSRKWDTVRHIRGDMKTFCKCINNNKKTKSRLIPLCGKEGKLIVYDA